MAASDPVVLPAGTAILAANVDALEALTGTWSSFTPVWTSTGTAPAIGDGTLESRYVQAGKLVIYSGRMLTGSTTTYGTGLYSMSLPVTSENGSRYVGSGLGLDSSTGTNNQPIAVRMDGTSAIRFYGTGGQVGQTVPFTWASGDQLLWTVTYQAA